MIVLLRKEHLPNPSLLAPMADQSLSPLLNLPAELRNTIWSYLLIQSQSPSAHRSTARPFGSGSQHDSRFCANILQTCKQAYAEGTPILYGENTFSAHPSLLTSLPSFLLVLRPNRVALPPVKHPRLHAFIRRYFIHVRLDTDPRFTRAQAEESFSGVDELEIEVFQAMYGGCDFAVLKLFEGVRGVRKAIVRGSIGDGEYAAWLTEKMMGPLEEGRIAGEDCGRDEEVENERRGREDGWHSWEQGNR